MLKFKKTTYISMLKKEEKTLHAVRSGVQLEKEPSVPEGLWIKCDQCGEMLYKEDVAKNYYVCYKCGKYFRLNARRRRRLVIDTKTFEEWDTDLQTENPLDYPGYEKKVEELQIRTKIHEAVVTGKGKINGIEVAIGICDGRFLMGSMGYVVGEKIARTIERATKEKLPVIIFACSGGARMQEGMVSLMQMAKTAAALKKHADEGLFYLSILTDPTTGGVTASFAMLGDIILAEPGALVGFAGPRVIEQTIGQKLPKGFQRAEFLVEHGLIDGIVERANLKDTLTHLLKMHERVPNEKWENLEIKMEYLKGPNFNEGLSMSAWERVQTSRMAKRPTASDYISRIFDQFIEMHGDRQFRDDGAIIGGIAYLDGCPVTVIGQQKGKNTKENIVHNFGMPYPEGYRKALRLMKQAEKFKRPIINFIDTPGAFCGLEAEERGQGEAIARNLMEMSGITVPILSIVIGEGGSGGALALAVGNEVWMMENATYSILSPEGFASILWKDSKRANEAAQVMKVTSFDLLHMKIIDKIIPERQPANPGNVEDIAVTMKENVKQFLKQFALMDETTIVENRYERFRRM